VRQAGQLAMTAEALRVFADSLGPEDEVAIEATCNTHAIVRLIESRVSRMVVSNPMKTRAIAEAKVKTDKVDAAILAQLLAADYLPSVCVADDATHALRRQVARRAHIVRQRTRSKNQVQAILQRNLIPRCPMSDMFGVKGRCWLGDQHLPRDEEISARSSRDQSAFERPPVAAPARAGDRRVHPPEVVKEGAVRPLDQLHVPPRVPPGTARYWWVCTFLGRVMSGPS
jgi:transposase